MAPRRFLVLLSVLLWSGCPSSGGTKDAAVGADLGLTGDLSAAMGAGDAAGGAGGCASPGVAGNTMSRTVGTVQATVVDQNGQPAAGLVAQVCGIDLCFPNPAAGAGVINVPVNHALKAPALRYGDGATYPRLALPLPAGDSNLAMIATAKLPDLGSGDPLLAGASAKSSGVTVDVAAGAVVLIDELSYSLPSQRLFRAVALPSDQRVPAVDATLGLGAVFGVAPASTLICPPATVHVPNTPKWAAGAAVEFFLHGTDVAQSYAPYGGWAKISDGAVSADGSEIVTSPGQGLPDLDTFGVRLKK